VSTNEQAPKEAEFFSAIRRWGITRGPNGVVGGVVEGFGARVGMARVPARIIVVVAALIFSGLILLAYAAAWALVPDRDGRIIIQDFGRGVTNVGALIGIGVLTLLGFGGLDAPFMVGPRVNLDGIDNPVAGMFAVFFAVVIPLAVLASLIWLVVYLVRRNGNAGSNANPDPTAPAGSDSAAAVPANKTQGSAAAKKADAARTSAATDAPTDTSAQAPSAAAPRPYVPPASPPPPRVPGPGRVAYLSALALAFLVGAGVLYADRTGELAVGTTITWFTAYTIGLGVIVMLVGLAGRKMGFLGFVATVLAASLALTVAANDDLRETFRQDRTWFAVEVNDAGDVDEFVVFGEEVVLNVADRFPAYESVEHHGICASTDHEAPREPDRTVTLTDGNAGTTINADDDRITLVTDGRGFLVVGEHSGDVVVEFEDQGIACTTFNQDGLIFSAIADEQPATTLNIQDNGAGQQMVYVKETA